MRVRAWTSCLQRVCCQLERQQEECVSVCERERKSKRERELKSVRVRLRDKVRKSIGEKDTVVEEWRE